MAAALEAAESLATKGAEEREAAAREQLQVCGAGRCAAECGVARLSAMRCTANSSAAARTVRRAHTPLRWLGTPACRKPCHAWRCFQALRKKSEEELSALKDQLKEANRKAREQAKETKVREGQRCG